MATEKTEHKIKTAEKKETVTVQTAVHKEKKSFAKPSKDILKKRALIKRKHLPSFMGRFGKECIRSNKIRKWQRWRKPRGEDIVRYKEDGARPKAGYRTPNLIRYLHPSGYKEIMVHNPKELAGLKEVIVRIAGAVGKKKRKIIIAEAKKAGLKLAN